MSPYALPGNFQILPLLKIWKIKNPSFTLYLKVLFMSDQNQSINTMQEISDIKRIMERSSRFISLSGLSGIAAGICALAGAWFANNKLDPYYARYDSRGSFDKLEFHDLKRDLLMIAAIVLIGA